MTTLRIVIDEQYKDFLSEKYSTSFQYKMDIGFDLYLPEDVIVFPYETKFINLGIRCEYSDKNSYYGYHLYPRSSISKTKVRLANSVGIIDPNYRGYLIAAVDNISSETQFLKKGERYFQLVFVEMTKPYKIEFVDSLSETERGDKGFGSTN